MNGRMTASSYESIPMPMPRSHGTVLQRQCACGNHTTAGGECEECKKKKSTLQRKASQQSLSDDSFSLPSMLVIQRKLTIGASDDPLEQEADRVADQVLAAPANPAVSGASLHIQRYVGQTTRQLDIAPASVEHVLASPGRPLDPVLQQDMGNRFGHDFSQVRVHSGRDAEQSAREVSAHAYTVGNNIVFGAGQFAPGTQGGRRLLAHELTHVIQQLGSTRIRVDQNHEKQDYSPIISTPNGNAQLQRFLSSEPAGGCGVCYGIPANAGKAAHSLIQTEFEVLYPLGLVELGVQSAEDENGRLDLAIAVPGGFEIGEIKPANEQGYEDGITQIAKYIDLLSARFPSATIKPLTKLLPPVIFPTLSSNCPVQALFVNPPVGGVYGYFCKPSFAQLKQQGCSCPAPRKRQEETKEDKKEQKKQQQTAPIPNPATDTEPGKEELPVAAKSAGERILNFIEEILVSGKNVEQAVRQFLKDNPEIVKNIEVAVAAIIAGAIVSDILSAGAAIAKDPAVVAILTTMLRIAQTLEAH